MSNLLFKKGTYDGLKALELASKIENGTIYFTADEGGLYIGAGDAQKAVRIQGSVLYFDTVQDFFDKTEPPYSSDVLYFIAKSVNADGTTELWNALLHWDPTAGENKTGAFVQINTTAQDLEALTGRVTATETGISDLREDLETANDEIEALQNKDDAIDVEIADIKRILGGVATDENLEKLNQTVQEHTTKIEAINGEINTIKGNIETINGNITNLDTNKADKTEVTAVDDKVTALTGVVTGQGTTIGEHTKSIEDLKAEDVKINAALSKKAESETVQTLDAEVDALTARVAKNETDISSANGEIERHGTAIENLKTRASDLERDVGELQTLSEGFVTKITYNEHIGHYNDLVTEVGKKASADALATVQSRVDNLETSVNELNDTVPNLATKDELANAKTALLSNINENTANIAKNAAAIGENADAIDELQSTTAEHETAIGELDSRLDGHDNSISTLTSGVADNAAAIATKAEQSALDAVDGKIGDIGDTTVAERLAAHDTSISNLQSEDSRLAGEIDKLKNADTEINTQINSILTNKADKTALAATDAKVAEHGQTIAEHTTSINAIKGDYLKAADKTELLNKITNDIHAANAMTYKGGIADADEFAVIKNSGTVSIGDTYVITAPFGDNALGQLYAGDLVVASVAEGKKEDNGVIPTDDLVWVKVDTGYVESHESTLDVKKVEAVDEAVIGEKAEKAIVRLSSHIATKEDERGNLGKITIQGSENITIETTGDATSGFVVNIGMKWGSF